MDSEYASPVSDAIERIRSSGLKERQSGLTDLKCLLEANRKTLSFGELEDKTIHYIYEALFRCASLDRSSYVKAGKSNVKTLSAQRLSLCARVLRLVIEVTVAKIRSKTLKALLDHICQSVPVPGEGLCDPLIPDYLKVLEFTFAHAPHAEHLSRSDWVSIVEFCLESVRLLESGSELASNPTSSHFSGSQHANGIGNSTIGSSSGASGVRVGESAEIRSSMLSLLECIHHLVSASNCPLLDVKEDLVSSLIGILQTRPSVGDTHVMAFAIINKIFVKITVESTTLTKQTIEELLPIMKACWAVSKQPLREEIIITLLQSEAPLLSLVGTARGNRILVDIENLLEAMMKDYSKYSDKAPLDLEDLDFGRSTRLKSGLWPMRTSCFSLRQSVQKSEYNWTVVHLMAFMACWIDSELNVRDKQNYDQESGSIQTKKRRETVQFEELLRQTSKDFPSSRICALQVISFVVQQKVLSTKELIGTMEVLLGHVSNQNTLISCWAMVAIASCTVHKEASIISSGNHDLKTHWATAWQFATRLVTSGSHCRPACNLLCRLLERGLLEPEVTAETMNLMLTSSRLNGPALLSDSALALWTFAFRVSDMRYLQKGPELTINHLLTWLFDRLHLGYFEKAVARQISHTTTVSDIVECISTSVGRSWMPSSPVNFMSLGVIGQSWLRSYRNRTLTNYLLLLDDKCSSGFISGDRQIGNSVLDEVKHSSQSMTKEVSIAIELFIEEINRIIHRLTGMDRSAPPVAHSDTMYVFLLLLINSELLSSTCDDRNNKSAAELAAKVEELSQEVFSLAFQNGVETAIYETMLHTVTPFLPAKLEIDDGDVIFRTAQNFTHLVARAASAYKVRLQAENLEKNDDMDLDSQFESQNSRHAEQNHELLFRHTIEAQCSPDFCFASIAAYVSFGIYFSESSGKDGIIQSTTSSYFQHILEMQANEFLSCGQFICLIVCSELDIASEDAEAFLLYIGENFLATFEYERCELSIDICLCLMRGLAPLWIEESKLSLREAGDDIYIFIVDILFGKSIASSSSQIRIADLLYTILNLQPEYAPMVSRTSVSVRTSLFQILQFGELVVKHHVAQRISNIFGYFVLASHDLIFEDVHKSLPSNISWPEGMSIRLLVLSQLGSTWKSLLRRCVYHIFETAGLVTDTIDHATICVKRIAKALDLPSAQSLFDIFQSQILYTWLETQSIESIPYKIFEFESLTELLCSSQDEIVSQSLMRGSHERLKELEGILKRKISELLSTSFSLAAAYCFAKDIQISDPLRSAENRIKSCVSIENWSEGIQNNFERIIGHFFLRLQEEDQFEKVLSKLGSLPKAAQALSAMRNVSWCKSPIPPGQQPLFRSKYLIPQIERLCRRRSNATNIQEIWSPSLVRAVGRMLLDDMHPALGPMHCRRTIQRVRILVALSGDTACENYPLQMFIHAIRPFVANKDCSEDSIGILTYLLTHGKESLRLNPAFFAGTVISLFISLRDFLKMLHKVKVPPGQPSVTISQVQNFQQWLSEYVHEFDPKYEIETSNKAFKSLFNTATKLCNPATTIKDTVESTLLWQLLVEMKSDRIGLGQPFLQLCFDQLCKDFKLPQSLRDDILGTTEKAVIFVPEIWKICERQTQNHEYRIWAAKIMGRAFRSNGKVPIRMSRECNMHLSRTDHELNPAKFLTSRLAIVKHLIAMLFRENALDVGLLERTLRLILSRVFGREDEQAIKDCFPSIVEASFRNDRPTGFAESDSTIPSSLEWPWSSLDMQRPYREWVCDFATATSQLLQDDPVIGSITDVLMTINGIAEQLYPYLFHSLVLRAVAKTATLRKETLSAAIHSWFQVVSEKTIPHMRLLINTLLYLRTQSNPFESSRADRSKWLDLDYEAIAHVARTCKMSKSALLFIELGQESPNARKSPPFDLLLSIFLEIDEPDSYYGVPQKPLLDSIANRLEFEGSGVQGLLFRGARLDGLYRSKQNKQTESVEEVIKALTLANLHGVTAQLVSNRKGNGLGSDLTDNMLCAAQRLGLWDLPAFSKSKTDAGNIYSTFQSIVSLKDQHDIRCAIEQNLLEIFDRLRGVPATRNAMRSSLRALAALTEIDDVACSQGKTEISEALGKLSQREQWMSKGHLEDIAPIFSSRETFTSMLTTNSNLRQLFQQTSSEMHLVDVQTNLQSSSIYREHHAFQEALATVTYLSQIMEPCQREGLQIGAAIRNETANVLWERGELVPSINILQELKTGFQTDMQAIKVGRPRLLARLGNRVSEARLESSEQIQRNYLIPSLEILGDVIKGDEAGHVFHDYASYCHEQLQNPELKAEITRIEKLRNQKQNEIQVLSEELASEKKRKATSSKQKNIAAMRALQDAKKWLEIDLTELERLYESRKSFLTSSLDYYLKSLAASDSHDDDTLRFFEIWLEFSNDQAANQSALSFLKEVPSHKFAHLMNQLVSRLEDNTSQFQECLSRLVYRICSDHPYHSMYQVCSASNINTGGSNDTSSRTIAAGKIVEKLKSNSETSGIWNRIQQAHLLCLRLAEWSAKDDYKVNGKILVTKVAQARRVARDLPPLSLPPMTLSIDLQANRDYSNVPIVEMFDKELRVMNGNSAPKLASLVASDGVTHKQLFKSNDDLRQDAIMEQVFGEVNVMLKRNPPTRQRDLRIRTYNVLPLSSVAGVIEFVQQTIAIHEFLVPAHQSYNPTDLQFVAARNKIFEAEKESVQKRVKVYQDVSARYQPVMRHFFFERFLDPDDWFQRRLAYTRSNATISILGHALGLGDRHCHNILLDQRTGEVVHIDLGIAFEAGRVLKIPEVVPFRLTRDIVDGFGIMKTEGIYRRCCGFTLEALRHEKVPIMTLLNVLRYDPLYRWTLSPVRAKRLQEQQDRDANAITAMPGNSVNISSVTMRLAEPEHATDRKRSLVENNRHEVGEAERALTVVERKLSPSLSVEAAVNELIQQATDEKNLAVLFCGWAAFS